MKPSDKPVTPCFWFEDQASEAAAFYCKHFKDARITAESPFATAFETSGQPFICLNGGMHRQLNPAISFYYICETEEELDALWNAFSKQGKVLMPLDQYPWSRKYGWVQDQYGVSWQLALGDIADVGQKITPCLMFVGNQYGRAEAAIEHYGSIFNGYALDGILRYGKDEAPDEEGKVKHAQFALNGQKFMVMDSADQHDFTFNEGISLMVYCNNQAAVDHYWDHLVKDGEESMCGWLKDKYGVSWQIVPVMLEALMSHTETAEKTATAFMQMKKIDIATLEKAASGEM